MKVEHTTNTITPSHTGLVFASKKEADQKDLSNVVGRFDEKRREIALLDGTRAGDKYRALINAGLQVHLAKDDRNNYYITGLLDNISSMAKSNKSFSECSEAIEQGQTSELSTVDSDERPDILFKEFDAFMAEDNDSAMDLDFTLPSLKYEHRVGLYNEDKGTYTLREDVLDLLDEFSFHINENNEGVVARINPESLNGRTLLKLTNLLKKQEQDDDDELQEALDSNKVNFAELAIVKSLLSRLRLARKHGDIMASDEAETELSELIAQYSKASPPACGIDKVKRIAQSILGDKPEAMEESQSAHTVQCIQSILEQDGVQLRGQQYA
ncbi:TPA: hypothetical protein NKQ52_005063 [Vibrio parahaemolyticus]|nr:hypothetical protein [Vibrio parahaemolyticus]HCH1657823.1 hypothetical protein [Vibrio parahaemolyticus]HCH1661190.1 hypothetical protein [Vibrio parahaemolyticus]